MKTTFLRALTDDGLELHGLLYEPDVAASTAVLHIHGMGGNFYENRFLDVMAARYTDAGITLLSVNTSGHDTVADFVVHDDPPTSQRIGSAYEVFADCLLDIAAWVEVLERRGYSEVVLQGHSLGASKVTYYAARCPALSITRVVLLSPTEMLQFAEGSAGHPERLACAMELVAAGRGDELLPGFVWSYGFLLSAATYADFTTRDNPIDVFRGYDPEGPAPLGQVSLPMLVVMPTADSGLPVIGRTAEEHLAVLCSKATGAASCASLVLPDDHGFTGDPGAVVGNVLRWLAR